MIQAIGTESSRLSTTTAAMLDAAVGGERRHVEHDDDANAKQHGVDHRIDEYGDARPSC